ncbi:MAG: M28 family peptidase [Bacteroidales bacterium]|jgi:hypothetical protein|nr:M28 family peptidase [Bacteroidales bacterium]
MKQVLIFLIAILISLQVSAQDEAYARKVLEKLTSPAMKGRGYVKHGDQKAAGYIARQFKKHNLQSFGDHYFQSYSFPINTLPGKIKVKVDGMKLKPGIDYVVSSSTPSMVGEYELINAPDYVYNDSTFEIYMKDMKAENSFLVIRGSFKNHYGKSIKGVKGVIELSDKNPWWHVSNADQVATTCWIKMKNEYFPEDVKSIFLDIENEFIPSYPTQNVIAIVKGKSDTNNYIVFAAHYDHLGMMGRKTYFPGANDNASGTAMLLDLAAYYGKTENQPEKSIVFMAFSGEEAGLHGSTYYADHPLFPLEMIDFLINLDMVGTGSDGITVVNGEAYKDVMDDLQSINDQFNYVPEIKARGEACNSDHCPLYNKGVKSVFIYTRGHEQVGYHTVFDTSKDFPFTIYDGLFRLLTTYVNQIDD